MEAVRARSALMCRLAALGLGSVGIYLLLRRLSRAWKDRQALAELLVSLSAESAGTVHREVPDIVVDEFAKVFSKVFIDNSMYQALYQGKRSWRKAMLEQLFKVHTKMANDHGRVRYFVDRTKRKKDTRIPLATCFASVYSSAEPEPGLLDVVTCGGLPVFAKMGSAAFIRSYTFENWLLELRKSVARDREYLCLDHLFVRKSDRGSGLGSAMLREIVDEAFARRLPILVTLTDERGVHFFTRFGFQVVCCETYQGVLADGSDVTSLEGAPLPFDVWILWREVAQSCV